MASLLAKWVITMAKTSRKYWQDRIEEQLDKQYRRANTETERALTEIYKATIEDVQNDILKLYAQVERQKVVGEDVTINTFYRNKRYWDWLDRMNQLLRSLGRKQLDIQEPELVNLYKETLETLEKYTPESIKGMSGGFSVASAVKADDLLNMTWCLDGKNFSSRVWDDKSKMLTELNKELQTCIIQGKHPLDSAYRVADRLNVSKYNATRLMRTETAHIQVYGKIQKYKEYGITQARYIASPGCCDECQANDGKIFPIDEIESMLPAHPNCRCSFGAVVPR